MTEAVPSRLDPRIQRARDSIVGEWLRVGSQTQFYTRTLGSIPDALIHYRTEVYRLIATIGLGSGALAIVGGTVAIVGFLTMTTGALVAIQGYNQFASGRVEAPAAFAPAF